MAISLVLGSFSYGTAEENGADGSPAGPPIGWSGSVEGGYVHQFDTDLDGGGSFSVNRFFVQGGPTLTIEPGRAVSLTVGYGFDGYNFSGHEGFAALKPWEDVSTIRFSLPVRWRFDAKWSMFVGPTLRFTGERGADFSDSMTGGVFGGVAYRVNDRLTIGPGVGVLTQLEDSTKVIPVLIIDWKITDTLSLTTGRGIGATLGPGLALDWQPAPKWQISVGGRYESLRFRLDKDGKVPKGIGDDRSFPIFLGAIYRFTPRIQAGLIGGLELGGELSLEDEDGHTIAEDDHDSAGFFGVSFSARF